MAGSHMSVDLAQVDLIRERMRCSYEGARDALQATNGDVVSAPATLEKRSTAGDDMLALVGDVVDDVQRLLELGPIRGLRVRLGDRVVREIPVTVTAAGAV